MVLLYVLMYKCHHLSLTCEICKLFIFSPNQIKN
ncbi:hypothetical protein PVAP13_3NG228252 [Panicum virgatum]|uniref:Uncharacterized protein n=1 Tax=Panicum virgatum TaxID=38727 RepID=A0A8T0UA92_PANVG|nr:hypothetical protein PVAP13_3NG228252 [Panicum virgatum]